MDAAVTLKTSPQELNLLVRALKALAAEAKATAANRELNSETRHTARQVEAQALELAAKLS